MNEFDPHFGTFSKIGNAYEHLFFFSDTTDNNYCQIATGTVRRRFMTLVGSVAAMPDDIRQSSIQHCSTDTEGSCWQWEWCTHANRNIL